MIEYICKKCEKRYKVKEYVQLIMIYDQNSFPTGRKCDSCGNEIGIDDKNVTI